MLSNEPNMNLLDHSVQYNVKLYEKNTVTELVKGRKVKGNDLVLLLWKLIPAVYLQMKNRRDKSWELLASYLKEELSERISLNAFWFENLNTMSAENVSFDKQININSLIMDEDHIDLVFTSSNGLSGKDYLEGIVSLIQKTYSVLLAEESTSAQWLKHSLTSMVQLDSFWDEGIVSKKQTEKLRKQFYDRNKRFS